MTEDPKMYFKPCPFCGGGEEKLSFAYGRSRSYVKVKCACGAEGREGRKYRPDLGWTSKDLIEANKAWNDRFMDKV